jgi:hypothetical protein
MSAHVERSEFARTLEPFGLLTEGAAGIVVIVLAVIALAGVSTHALASIAAIVIGGGLMVQAMNSAAEQLRPMAATAASVPMRQPELSGDVLVDCLCGVAGIVLGILALVGAGGPALLSAALIVYGGALLVGGAASTRLPGLIAPSAMEMLIGLAAIVLGIVSVLMTGAAMLVLIGFLTVGAAMLLVSAAFGNAVTQLFRTV